MGFVPVPLPAGVFNLGGGIGGSGALLHQKAYLAAFDILLTPAMCQSFWRSILANSDLLGTDNTYARTNPLRTQISASRVAAWGAGQVALGYDAAAVAADNPLGVGVVASEGLSFLGIGSDNFYTNAVAQAGGTKTACDGPSGMRDGCNYEMGNNWGSGTCAYMPSGGKAISGISNVSWRGDISYRQTFGGATRLGFNFTGSASGAEFFTILTVPIPSLDWSRGGGACTPVYGNQTAFSLCFGCEFAFDNMDFAEPAAVKNCYEQPAAWRAVGTSVAAADTSTPALSVTNVGNARYSPARGRTRIGFTPNLAPQLPGYLQTLATVANTPTHIAFDQYNQTWIVRQAANLIDIYNTKTGAFIATVGSGTNPFGIAVSEVGHIWLTNLSVNQITVIDAATRGLISTFAAGGINPNGIACDGYGQMWVGQSGATNAVRVFNTVTRAFIGQYATQTSPSGMAVHPSSGEIWITNWVSNSVTVYNTSARTLVGHYPTGGNSPYNVTFDRNGRAWVGHHNSGSNNWVVFNRSTKAIVATVAYPSGEACVDPTTGMLVAPDEGSTTINLIEPIQRRIAGTLTAPNNVHKARVDWSGRIWVLSNAAAQVYIYSSAKSFLRCGAEFVAGGLSFDYRAKGITSVAPLTYDAYPACRLRVWDNAGAEVCDLDCGGVAVGSLHTRDVEWDAVIGKIAVFDGPTVLAAHAGTWTPGAADVTPIYVGAGPSGAGPARSLITRVHGYNY
jgi:streptogramin lyase